MNMIWVCCVHCQKWTNTAVLIPLFTLYKRPYRNLLFSIEIWQEAITELSALKGQGISKKALIFCHRWSSFDTSMATSMSTKRHRIWIRCRQTSLNEVFYKRATQTAISNETDLKRKVNLLISLLYTRNKKRNISESCFSDVMSCCFSVFFV